jgi:VanZ family protein
MAPRAARIGARSYSAVRSVLGGVWHRRRWIYGAWMVLAVTRIPARTGFRLTAPTCDTALTLENLALSLTKVPHIVLFGAFFLITLIQFDRVDRRSLAWSVAATAGISLVIEIEQGATRTGNCRMTDVAPNLAGALIVAVLVAAAVALRNRITNRASSEV